MPSQQDHDQGEQDGGAHPQMRKQFPGEVETASRPAPAFPELAHMWQVPRHTTEPLRAPVPAIVAGRPFDEYYINVTV